MGNTFFYLRWKANAHTKSTQAVLKSCPASFCKKSEVNEIPGQIINSHLFYASLLLCSY